MNKTIITALAITALTLSGTTAFAGGHKTSLLHCGCTEAGDAMLYKVISVSSKSKGHQNHEAMSADACLTGFDVDGNGIYVDFVRIGDDCTLEGGLAGLEACEGPMESDTCGAVLID